MISQKNMIANQNLRLRLIVMIVSLFVMQPLYAAKIEGLYEAEIPVANQGSSARAPAMKTGLSEVFAKVSGQPGIASINPNIGEYLKEPQNLLQQYLYRKLPESQRNSGNQQLLWMRFDEKAINKIIRDNGETVWGKTRPATLIWLAVEEGNKRMLMGGGSLPGLQDIMNREAKRYGVALVIPLMDLEDEVALKFADVWGNFQEAIFRASQRYQADAILVGRLSVTGANDWSGRWDFYYNQQQTNWGSQSIAVEDVLSSGIIGTMELQAKVNKEAIQGEGGTVVLTVQDVNSLNGLETVGKYLRSLEQTKSVLPASVNGPVASFFVDVRGSAEGLARTIALGSTLRRVDDPGAMESGGLHYRLMP